MKLAELVYTHGISTVVEFGAECFSSCAIIFMAGVTPNKEIPCRKLSTGGVLGFHAPYVKVPDQKYSREELEGVATLMTKSILELVRLASKETKLGDDFIKKSMIQRILEKGRDEVFFVKRIFDAARWNIEIYDAGEHFVVDAGKIRGVINMCNNFHFANMDQDVSRAENLSVHIEDYSSKYHSKDFRVLVRNSKTKDVVCELYPKEDKRGKVIITACSHDYWSSKTFGDCREYKTRPSILIGKHVPNFFALDPNSLLKRFQN